MKYLLSPSKMFFPSPTLSLPNVRFTPPSRKIESFLHFVLFPLKPLYFSLYYVSYTPNVYKLSYVSGFISLRCSFFGLKDLKKKLVLSQNYNRSKTPCSYHSIGLTSYSTSSWLCALKWL